MPISMALDFSSSAIRAYVYAGISILGIVFTVFTADILGVNTVDQFSVRIEQMYGSDTIAAVPETIVPFGTIRGFVIHEEHILLLASDIGNHPARRTPLLHVPDNPGIGLLTVEFRMDAGPYLREIELIWLPFVPERGEEFSWKSQWSYLRPSSSDIENAVRQFPAGELAGEVAG